MAGLLMLILALCSPWQQRMWPGANMNERKHPGRDKPPVVSELARCPSTGSRRQVTVWLFSHLQNCYLCAMAAGLGKSIQAEVSTFPMRFEEGCSIPALPAPLQDTGALNHPQVYPPSPRRRSRDVARVLLREQGRLQRHFNGRGLKI